LALLPRLVSAQGEAPSDDEVNLIAKKLFCPVCENVPLDVCPTQACAQWRATIREKLVEGWTEQQILDYFVQQYGERVLAQPSSRGLNFLVWLLPPLALAAGAFFLWRFLSASARVRLSATPAQAAPSLPPTDKYAAMLEEELRKRR
jgi:cytochrome c-type biogenesis protein CcmH